jgi:hypothetical protein
MILCKQMSQYNSWVKFLCGEGPEVAAQVDFHEFGSGVWLCKEKDNPWYHMPLSLFTTVAPYD